jgi:hypothetical protein
MRRKEEHWMADRKNWKKDSRAAGGNRRTIKR